MNVTTKIQKILDAFYRPALNFDTHPSKTI